MTPGSVTFSAAANMTDVVIGPGDTGNTLTLWSSLQDAWIDRTLPPGGLVFNTTTDTLLGGTCGAILDDIAFYAYASLNAADNPQLDFRTIGYYSNYHAPGPFGFHVDTGFGASPGTCKKTFLGMQIKKNGTVCGDSSSVYNLSWYSQGTVSLVSNMQPATLPGDGTWHELTPTGRKLGFLLSEKTAPSLRAVVSIGNSVVGQSINVRLRLKYAGALLGSSPQIHGINPDIAIEYGAWTAPNTAENKYELPIGFCLPYDGYWEASLDVMSPGGTIYSGHRTNTYLLAERVPF